MVFIKNEWFQRGPAFFEKNEKAVKLIAFLSFVCLTFIVGIFHEPWADEAQSWLIARDTSPGELFKVMAYEGSPSLWPIILKIFIFIGLTYRYLFVVPFLFSAIGVWLLIFKSKIPLFFAVILPYTYYIFYQYTVIARSYCLILPCIGLIALAFPNRLRNPYVYGLLLILLSGICIHTALLSGILLFLFCIDICKSTKHAQKMQTVNAISAAIIVVLSYISTVWYLRPPVDYSFPAFFDFELKEVLIKFLDLFGNVFIYNSSAVFNMIVMLIIWGILLLFNKISVQFILIASAVWVFLSLFYYNQWHIGIVFLSFLLAFQLYPPEPRQKATLIGRYKVYLKIIIGFFAFTQIFWSVSSAVYDISKSYSGAYSAAIFIRDNQYDRQRIYGLGYYATALEPYFETNIYKNKTRDKAYYLWSIHNGDLTNEQIIADLPPVVILSEFDKGEFSAVEAALNATDYRMYEFDGDSYIKKDVYQSQKYYVYVKKALVKDSEPS